MSISSSPKIEYPQTTIQRAKIALKCSPFHLKVFQQMRSRSVPIGQIANDTGVKNGYITRALSELKVENELVWLIKVGLLRREVDGQGITDSFRLTPLGRQIVAEWEQQLSDIPTAALTDKIKGAITRWFRVPL